MAEEELINTCEMFFQKTTQIIFQIRIYLSSPLSFSVKNNIKKIKKEHSSFPLQVYADSTQRQTSEEGGER